jgi:hypothetical protein
MVRGRFKKSIFVLLMIAGGSRLEAGKYANAFLEIGCGARALAMGGAVTADISDGTAFYWNPAGLARIERVQLTGMYGPQFGTFKDPLATYHQIGIAIPLRGEAVIAANWIRLAVDEIPIYPELAGNSFYERFMNASLRPSGDPEGYFSDSENAFFVSFAKRNAFEWDMGWDFHRVRIEIPVGLNIKWISQEIGDYQASGLGVDVGGMFRIHLNDLFQIAQFGELSLGLNIQDVTRTTMSWNTKRRDTVPHNVRFGVAYRQPIRETMILTFCVDRESRWEKRDRFGFEFSGWNRLALRVGADSGRITAGAGFHFWCLFVDYAFLSHELDVLHRVSLCLSL